MILSLEYIRDYIHKNNLDDLDINKSPIKPLGILNIIKTLSKDKESLLITIKGPKNSFYEKGVFKISIDLPIDFPITPPKVIFRTKIAHIQVSEGGHLSVLFLVHWNWNKSTSLKELLVGLYLFFIFDQNISSPFGSEYSQFYGRDVLKFKEFVDKLY